MAVTALRLSEPGARPAVNSVYRPASETAACTGPGCKKFQIINLKTAGNEVCTAHQPVIGMLDTSIDTSHLALRGQAIETLQVEQRPKLPSSASHGTAVAALLVGAGDGPVPGLLPDAKLVAIDVFHTTSSGDETDAASLIQGIEVLVDHGVKVINLSLTGPANSLLQEAIDAAAARGTVIVAAAGNGGPGAEPAYPAAYDNVIAVTAVDHTLAVYDRAPRGSYITLAAPGVKILVAAAKGGTEIRSGTSYAAPFVAAAAAVAVAASPEEPAAKIAEGLEADARDLGDPGRDDVFGAGLLSASRFCPASASPAQAALMPFAWPSAAP